MAVKVEVTASKKLLHLSLNSLGQMYLESFKYLLMRINAVSALKSHMLKTAIWKRYA